MTLFEYMSVAISLVLALTFAEGLRGLRSALQADRRYGVHATWLLVKISNPMMFWWALWGWRDNPEFWNVATYSLGLINPGLVYLQVHSLVGDTPDLVTDWRTHFYDQRKWFFGINTILAALTAIIWSGLLPASVRLLIPMLSYTFLMVLSIVGYVSDRPKLHVVIISVVVIFNLLYYSLATFRPITL